MTTKMQFQPVITLHHYVFFNGNGKPKVYANSSELKTDSQKSCAYIWDVYTNQMYTLDMEVIDPADWEWGD